MASVDTPRGRGGTPNSTRGNHTAQPARARGRGTSKARLAIVTPPPSETSQKVDKKSVHWTNDQTDLLVTWLTSHPADCHVLFYENKGDRDLNNKPSAKDKTGIHDIIAQHIFKTDQHWAEQYSKSPKKFGVCVSNRISYLRKAFIKHHGSLGQTGHGIQPGDGAVNPLAHVLKEFPWYNDLFGIWNGIPNFTAKITTSEPGKSRGANHLKLVATRSKATPPPTEGDGSHDPPYADPQPVEAPATSTWNGVMVMARATEDLDRPSPSPEPFQIPDKGTTSGYDSRHTGFQFAAAKAHAINSRVTSRPPSSRAVSCPPSSRAASRPPSSHADSHPSSSRAASRPPTRVPSNHQSSNDFYSPLPSKMSTTSSDKGKRIRLDLQDQMSQVETTAASDAPGGQRLAVIMEKNHHLATKLNHVDREHDRQLQRERMNLEKRRWTFDLEEAKTRASEQRAKEHLAMAEMLRLQLKLKGVDGADVEHLCPHMS
ncbi:hypothetical protein BU15DRAFT_67428 [Melanogaster broomeanus]|nr:hypothetical protein BU15DRAFT_67428 [Melanogaster broomeanus]